MRFDARPFGLAGFQRAGAPGAARTLRVYIEGDGLAWRTRRRPSPDPTPEHPIALALAARDPGPGPVLYLARPCQYVGADTAPCEVGAWTHARFSEAVVASTGQAVDCAKRALAARELELVGYSGGGVVAALVAARRHDVARLVTLAAPLDPRRWTAETHSSPLWDSLDPVDFADALRGIPQLHYLGARDARVPRGAVDAYLAALAAGGAQHRARALSLPGFDHDCCWIDAWPGLLDDVIPSATPAGP